MTSLQTYLNVLVLRFISIVSSKRKSGSSGFAGGDGVLGGDKLPKEVIFPCNAIDIMLKLSIVWKGPNHGFRAFGIAMAPLGSTHAKRQHYFI